MRDAPSIDIIQGTFSSGERRCGGVTLAPSAVAAKMMPEMVACALMPMQPATGAADLLILMTEWNQYRMLDLERVKE